MNEQIINGIFILLAALIGATISLVASLRATKFTELKAEIEKLKADLKKVANQVKAYWNLERLYTEKVNELTQENQRTILIEYRKKIGAMEQLNKPKMTAEEADKILRKYNLGD